MECTCMRAFYRPNERSSRDRQNCRGVHRCVLTLRGAGLITTPGSRQQQPAWLAGRAGQGQGRAKQSESVRAARLTKRAAEQVSLGSNFWRMCLLMYVLRSLVNGEDRGTVWTSDNGLQCYVAKKPCNKTCACWGCGLMSKV